MKYGTDEIGYVYEYIHKESGKWYVGSRSGQFDPTYTGSGTLWKRAKEKHGLESYTLSILYCGSGFREHEENILTERDARNDPMSYNLKNEAIGGSFPGESNGMYGKKLNEVERYRCGSAHRGRKRPEHAIAVTGTLNGRYTHGKSTKEYARYRKEEREMLGVSFLRDTLKCPHCSLVGQGPNMTRYHFGKCKLNPDNPENILGEFDTFPRINGRRLIFKCPHCLKEGMNIGNMNRWHFDNCKKFNLLENI